MLFRSRNANDWATWKENTPFKPEKGWTLKATIESPAQNNRSNAIQYILLHEFAHVLASAGGVHPDWNNLSFEKDRPQDYPFSKLSWKTDQEGKAISLFENEFPQRKDVLYYFGDIGKKPPLSAARLDYRGLIMTGFATLYGATNMFDDFAEFLTVYVHTVVMKKPWKIQILHEGAPTMNYHTCWAEARCKEKLQFLKRFLSDSN